MRISFDLDDTLISRTHGWPLEPDLPAFQGLRERLRAGTVELFRWLRERQHEIWIYTNSYRGWKDLEEWFSESGIPVDGVINQVKHDEARMNNDPSFQGQKNPDWFDIDIHIDDQQELAAIAENCDFRVIIVDPDDDEWYLRVKDLIEDAR